VADWIAESVDRWWYEAGRPDPYTVVEVGAGDGTRAAQVLARGPECLDALRYIVVESEGVGPDFASHALFHGRALPVESPVFLFPPAPDDGGDAEEAPPATGIGPLVTSLGELPRLAGVAAVIAVDWVSRLPSDRVEWHDGRWHEVRVAAEGDGLAEVLVPLDPGRRAEVEGLIARPVEGGRYALLVGAAAWLGAAPRAADRGVLAVVDRWTESTEPHRQGYTPALAVDQLARVHRPLNLRPEPVPWGRHLVTWRLG
jgi:hypothetical protein